MKYLLIAIATSLGLLFAGPTMAAAALQPTIEPHPTMIYTRPFIPVTVQMYSTPLPNVKVHVGFHGHKHKRVYATNDNGNTLIPSKFHHHLTKIYAVSFPQDAYGYTYTCRHGGSIPTVLTRNCVLKYYPTQHCEYILMQLNLTPSFPKEWSYSLDFSQFE